MDEFGLCQSILATVEGRSAGRPVTGVRVRIGSLHHVYADAFEQAFALVAQGSVADGAELDLVVVPVRTYCRACGDESTSQEHLTMCRRCGSFEVDLEGGDDLILENLVLKAPS